MGSVEYPHPLAYRDLCQMKIKASVSREIHFTPSFPFTIITVSACVFGHQWNFTCFTVLWAITVHIVHMFLDIRIHAHTLTLSPHRAINKKTFDRKMLAWWCVMIIYWNAVIGKLMAISTKQKGGDTCHYNRLQTHSFMHKGHIL